MTSKERLMNTITGKKVDRPAVSFYEINGLEDRSTDNPYNIYSDPSWQPLLDLARDKSDSIIMRSVGVKNINQEPSCKQRDKRRSTAIGMGKSKKQACLTNEKADPKDGQFKPTGGIKSELGGLTTSKQWIDDKKSKFTKMTIQAEDKTLTSVTRQDVDINTIWTIEHLLKDVDDFKAWIELPDESSSGDVDISSVIDTEAELGDGGIVMLDTPDPLCKIAPLFGMGEYTMTAFMEPELMHKALQKVSVGLYEHIEKVSKALPGHLWRIYGPEYAAPPYLPPHLFKEYVTDYVKPMVDIIHKYGGYARIHSHGNLKDVLDYIVATGCDGLDPIEPPNQGDVELSYVREKYGEQLVLFGNLEITDIENMQTVDFEKKVYQALEEGTSGSGRGFVLMPSAVPYGRKLSSLAMNNYEKIIEVVDKFN